MPLGWISLKTVVVWCSATCAGMAVCWLGVRPVLDAAVPDRLVAFPVDAPRSPTATPPARPSPSPSPSATTPSPSRAEPRPSGASASVSAPPTIIDGWTVQANGDFVRSFQLVGGSATVRAGGGAVELVIATPRQGFVMAVTPSGDDRVVVNFTGLSLHVSTLEVTWRDNAPVADVTELL